MRLYDLEWDFNSDEMRATMIATLTDEAITWIDNNKELLFKLHEVTTLDAIYELLEEDARKQMNRLIHSNLNTTAFTHNSRPTMGRIKLREDLR